MQKTPSADRAGFKNYYIKTFGCQANVADSNTMAGILEALGFEPYIPAVKEAVTHEKEFMLENLPRVDLLIVNTCSVRQKSEDKVYGIGKFIKQLKEEGRHLPYVVMSGCMVGSVTGDRNRFSFDELKKKTPWVDLYINPSQIWDLPNYLNKNGVLSDWALSQFDPEVAKPKTDGGKHAFVNVSYGCDNFCTFCVVPYSRGKEVSRSAEEIIKEIKHHMLRGIEEFTLCGQNVNSWGLTVSKKFKIRAGSAQKLPFAALLRTLCAEEGVRRLSFISSNPFDFTEDLIDAIKHPKISRQLHIAVQSGNNEILKKMNRRHTVEEFISLVGKILAARPDIELGTDAIVGFPGETREQFMDTVKLFEQIPFKIAYMSLYSSRKGTSAGKNLTDDVSLKEKKWRYSLLEKTWLKNRQK